MWAAPTQEEPIEQETKQGLDQLLSWHLLISRPIEHRR